MDFNSLDEVKTYIDDKIKDRRPTKIDASEMQSALLGISKFIETGVTAVSADLVTITGDGTPTNPLIANQEFLSAEIAAREALAASLDNKADLVSGKVPASQLPSFVDDVIEGEYIDSVTFNVNDVAITPESGKIYLDIVSGSQYRWSGTVFIQITASPGTTDNVPEGTTNKYFTAQRVLWTVLTGLGFSDATTIKVTDNIIAALGKLQAQINNFPVAVKALFSDLNSGTDDTKFATSLALEGSKYLTQNGSKLYAVTTGTNLYSATFSPANAEIIPGQHFYLKNGNTNTGACTLNIDGTGAKPLYKYINTPLAAGDLQAGKYFIVCYTGTSYQIVGIDVTLPSLASGEKVLSVTSSGVQATYDITAPPTVNILSLQAASWTNDECTGISGYIGQMASDSGYIYTCTDGATGKWTRYPRVMPSVASGEKALSVTSSGIQKSYDIVDVANVNVSLLQAASWTDNTCTGVVGFKTQMASDANYIYYCYNDLGYWLRIENNKVSVEKRLGTIDDSAGTATNSALDTAFPTAVIGNEVKGAVSAGKFKLYTKEAAGTWTFIEITNC